MRTGRGVPDGDSDTAIRLGDSTGFVQIGGGKDLIDPVLTPFAAPLS